jgi:DNA polymerase-3 subunit delta
MIESLRALLLAKQTPRGIMAALTWCWRRLRDYLTLTEAGVRSDFEFRKAGITSPQAKRDYALAEKRYDSTAVDRCLALTAEYDLRVSEAGGFPQEILMDEYLYKVHNL